MNKITKENRIELTYKTIICYEKQLYTDIISFNNHINECDCEDKKSI